MINTRAAGDSRFARTGKDGAIYNADGVLLATVDSFTANVTYNNAAYSVLGNAQELETANTFKVALTMSQVVVEDDAFIQELVEAMESQTMPVWDFQGVLKDMHEQFVEPTRKYADIVVLEGGHNLVALDLIMQRIAGHIAENPPEDAT